MVGQGYGILEEGQLHRRLILKQTISIWGNMIMAPHKQHLWNCLKRAIHTCNS